VEEKSTARKIMKRGSKLGQRTDGNKKYLVGSFQTPVGRAGIAVWLTEVEGIDQSVRHMIGIRRYKDTTLWVRDNDAGALELIRDRDAMLKDLRRQQREYSEFLREQVHGKR
jgi:hypothetical protein